MDYPIEDKAEIFQNFKELVFINTYLGGPIHSLNAIRKLSGGQHALSVADIGSGAGDFLNYLHQHSAKLPNDLSLAGIDMMTEAHQFARTCFQGIESYSELVELDYRQWFKDGHFPDIIHASLFCHHLTDDQLVEFFQLSVKQARRAVVVNDLHRHPLAYHSIKWLCAAFSKSRFTQNDAPLSVLRGFSRKELEVILERAGIKHYEIKWKWAFRFIIVIPANANK